MKCEIQGKYLYFTEYTEDELKWVDEKLTWEGYSYNEKQPDGTKVLVTPVEKLLLNHDGCPCTFFGLYEPLENIATSIGLKLDLTKRPDPPELFRVKISKNILPPDGENFKELAEFQVQAAEKAIMLKNGLTAIPTGGGKTEIILAILRYLIDNGIIDKALMIVPSKGLAGQFKKRALKRGFTNDEVGVYHGDIKEPDATIVVAVVNSINMGITNQKPAVLDLIKRAQFVGFDEAHHLRAETWIKIAQVTVNAEYLLGWSGSPFENEDMLESSGDALIYGLVGAPIFVQTYDDLRRLNFIADPIIHFKKVPGRYAKYHQNFLKIYNKYIVKDPIRNEMIVNYCRRFVQLGFPVLILVQKLEHARILMEMMPEVKAVAMFGGNKGLDRNEFGQLEEIPINYDTTVENFENRTWDVLYGSQVMDEGFDVPSIGAVILAGAGKSKIKILQRLGRGLRRKWISYNRVYLLDFWDQSHVYLASHSKKRKALFQEINAIMVEDPFMFINMVIAHSEDLKNEQR